MVGWPSGLGEILQKFLRRFDSYPDLTMEYNSVVECHSDTMKVGGSNPPTPTKKELKWKEN